MSIVDATYPETPITSINAKLGDIRPLMGDLLAKLRELTDNDSGTRIEPRVDVRTLMAGTRLRSIDVEGRTRPFVAKTRMARIRLLAPLTLREWATVFGVSHSAIRQWESQEADRDELNEILAVLEDAARYQADLGRWLTEPVVGLQLRPIDLLRTRNLRALRGAARTRIAPAPSIASDELMRRRKQEVAWSVPEVEITPTNADRQD
jgi:transcriptional regulator with XRE-family HTH domain